MGGYPGKLKDIVGLWVEEEDALPSGKENSFTYKGTTYPARLLCDLSHVRGAEVLAAYDTDFYAGMPVLTVNAFGEGKAYYVATRSNPEFYHTFLKDICEKADVNPIIVPQNNLEATERVNENGRFLFLLNHGEEAIRVGLEHNGTELITGKAYKAGEQVILAHKDVKIIWRK